MLSFGFLFYHKLKKARMKSLRDEIRTSLDEILGFSPQMKLNPPLINLPQGRFHRVAISFTIVDLVEKSTLSRAFFWPALGDSNPRPTESESGTLSGLS